MAWVREKNPKPRYVDPRDQTDQIVGLLNYLVCKPSKNITLDGSRVLKNQRDIYNLNTHHSQSTPNLHSKVKGKQLEKRQKPEIVEVEEEEEAEQEEEEEDEERRRRDERRRREDARRVVKRGVVTDRPRRYDAVGTRRGVSSSWDNATTALQI